MRISDWSSDLCSSDLAHRCRPGARPYGVHTSLAGEARSRHTKAVVPGLVPGTQCPGRLKVLPLRGGAFAAGGDAIVARHRRALMPMGPGDERRDDSCAYGAVEKSPPALCESSRVTPEGDDKSWRHRQCDRRTLPRPPEAP